MTNFGHTQALFAQRTFGTNATIDAAALQGHLVEVESMYEKVLTLSELVGSTEQRPRIFAVDIGIGIIPSQQIQQYSTGSEQWQYLSWA